MSLSPAFNERLRCAKIIADEQKPKGLYLSESTHRLCARLVPTLGKTFFQQPKTSLKKKVEFRQNVKSKVPTLSRKDETRLHKAAKVLTVEQRLDALARSEELAKQRTEQAERSREYFRKIDEQRLKDMVTEKEENEDLSGRGEKKAILEVAFLAKQEQEEEVKAVNRFILHAKCQAVRDAQIHEKRDIQRNQRAEQIRLERMVIDENAKALAMDDTYALKQRERCEKYAREIREQLLQRESLRYLEAERSEEEARVQREANEALQREEEQRLLEAKERRRKFRQELDRIVEMSNMFKKMLCEQEQEADKRVAEYMRQKKEQEKQLEREKALAREAFERRKQLLYQLAIKLMASKSQREEMNYLREQEHAEREYRRKEKESAMRRKRLEEDIRESRQRQSQEMKTRQALQIAREEKDFMLLIENLKMEEERLKKQEEELKRRRVCYKADITRQISDKAAIRRRQLENVRNEGQMLRETERERLAAVRMVISSKLSAIREACLPEQYIKDIERQMDRIIKRSPQQKPTDNLSIGEVII